MADIICHAHRYSSEAEWLADAPKHCVSAESPFGWAAVAERKASIYAWTVGRWKLHKTPRAVPAMTRVQRSLFALAASTPAPCVSQQSSSASQHKHQKQSESNRSTQGHAKQTDRSSDTSAGKVATTWKERPPKKRKTSLGSKERKKLKAKQQQPASIVA